jgi:hypothetical protein
MRGVFLKRKMGRFSVGGEPSKFILERMSQPAENGVLEVATQRLCPSQILRRLFARWGDRNRYICSMES